MKKIKNSIFIFDVDSTIVRTETLEDIIEIAIKNNSRKNDKQGAIMKQVQEITALGMSGKIKFRESLERRFKVVQILQKHIDFYNREILLGHIDSKFKEIIKFIQNNGGMVYIVSAGFRDNIAIVANELKVNKECYFANEFTKNDKKITGFNKNNPLSRSDGKIKIVEQLKEKYNNKKIICIGDGNSDYLIKKEGVADEFWGFWENVQRDVLIKKADKNFYSSRELLGFINRQV